VNRVSQGKDQAEMQDFSRHTEGCFNGDSQLFLPGRAP
jgi:hypothetical protein